MKNFNYYFNLVANGYFLKDVSEPKNIYKSYPSPAPTQVCSFNIDIYCKENASSGESCGNVVVMDSFDGTVVGITLKYEMGEQNVYQYNIVTEKSQPFQLGVGTNVLFSVDLECTEPDVSKITLNFISKRYLLTPYGTKRKVYGEYELMGLDPEYKIDDIAIGSNLLSDICSFGVKTLRTTLKNIFLQCMEIPFDLTEIQLQISSGSQSKNFNIEPIQKDFTEYSVYNITQFPPLEYSQGIDLLGYYQNPVLSFQANTTMNGACFGISVNNITVKHPLFFPIYGNEKETTYLFSMDGYEDTVYNLFYYSNSKYLEARASQQIKSNSKQFPINEIITTPLYNLETFLKFRFTENKNYYFNTLVYDLSSLRSTTKFPFGYIKGNSNGYTFEISSVVRESYFGSSYYSLKPVIESLLPQSHEFLPKNTSPYDITQSPSVYDSQVFYLDRGIYLIKLFIKTPYGFSFFKDENNQIIGSESFIGGNSTEGVYELKNFESFEIADQPLFYSSYSRVESSILYIKDENAIRNYQTTIQNFDILKIQDVSFLYNDLDITNHRCYNVFYFNYSDIVPRDTIFKMKAIETTYNNYYPNTFVSAWNETKKSFQIEFFVDSNTEIGEYQFTIQSNLQILYNNHLPIQLNIKKTRMDYQGPIFSNIKKIPEISANSQSIIFGWTLTIEDPINGFDHGFIVVKGESDQSTYNFSLTTMDVKKNGNIYLGEYDIKLNVSSTCVTQNYVISEVKLLDRMKRFSYFAILPLENYKIPNIAILNPFIKFIQERNINKYQLQCTISKIDSDPPILTQFIVPQTEIDVSSLTRVLNFEFSVTDQDSGIKDYQYPIVYISNTNNQILECKSNITSIDSFSASYSCSIQLPLGFGYPGILLFSVYGFINNGGSYSGYSSDMLQSNGFTNSINTLFNTIDPILTGHMLITEKGGDLWLYGRGLNTTISVFILYSDDSNFSTQPKKKYSTAILVQGIRPTTEPFEVYIEIIPSYGALSTISNKIIITPTLYDYFLDDCNNNGILINYMECKCNSKWTTKDIKSQCTIPNHYISSSTQVSHLTGGEITLYGWFGGKNSNPKLYIDNKEIKMTSTAISSDSFKVTIGPGSVGPIQVNYTQNSILWSGIIYPYLVIEKQCPLKCEEHGTCNKVTGTCSCNSGYTGFDCSSPINNNNNGTETHVDNNGTTIIKNQDIGYSISIDSIIELDFAGNSISTLNLTNNWIFVNKVGTVTTFNQTRDNEDKTQALVILAIEEVNDRDKDFTFAGNEFTVTKGGLKMSLSVSNWLYKSNLNTLQVQMSSEISDIQSNNCYKDERTSTIESQSNNNNLIDNINYLKITKNGNILYSRFQDKMLSDKRPTTVTAKILSKDKTSVKIALNLPHCDECLIDPDFSLLITSDYKTDCKSSKKWVIAVAVVCGVVGLAIVSISLYLIYKKSTFLKIKVYAFRKYLQNNNN
ncbi:hypothetical protein DICPUDRAFT_73857 [Dictyostelium purpureum]|uniref:EGF-like domain-containing protein n=1 Tax=Dictyostelium purpureum TaxID=5786 RepID=F0Z628_DICPU|nr:uncharacterized protein DICPUDRAFT_73857 [Dictyostelium purpureum]EGC40529.1 hypothetical protein DICPUDRAFT_73857 [Dictyostelium purpureum]|eukprot:XP_003282865.1 hypothetical protein DICPUDRAFT_73857 [Dictyostelium purpureum]